MPRNEQTLDNDSADEEDEIWMAKMLIFLDEN